jgi:anti-sigma regulatory factor (Ser/Thr protein kinase)
MGIITVLSTDASLNSRIRRYCNDIEGDFIPIFLTDQAKSLEYLNYELPEISVFNFSDDIIKMNEILESVKADPWLHYGGIIGVHNYDRESYLEKRMMDSNVVSLIQRGGFDFSFPRVLRILNQNRQIIFQRDIQSHLLANISGSFVIDNDPFDVKTYSNLVANYLFNSAYINGDTKQRLLVALMELLMNAIEHGNCQINAEEKNAHLEKGGDIFELIREKNKDSSISQKKVYFEYRITPQKSTYKIRDEGQGFDWQSRSKRITEDNYLKLQGRGIIMADYYTESLTYNDKGNEVQFELPHQENESNVRPQAFANQEETVFEDGEVVFDEGEESNFLYYIVSGKLKILANNKVLSTLTPDDIFLGEMSFLLNNRRSATVRSEGQTALLKISKESFVNVIKEKPHYGIFLARILAQRLNRLNKLF